MHVLIQEDFPFDLEENQGDLQKAISKLDEVAAVEKIGGLSDKGKNLLKKLLSQYPGKRPTASEALKDPWFKEFIGEERMQPDPKILDNLRKFKVKFKDSILDK